jgi:CRISPR system Cascade subunit CasE
MYLSRLRLDLTHPQARRDLASAYEMHRTLARVYAFDDVRPPARFLWRLEPTRDEQPPTLLVQAEGPGRWNTVARLAGYALSVEADKRVDSEALVSQGRHYRFRLLANATVTREGKRFGLCGYDALRTWIERQAGLHGFGLLGVDIDPQPRRMLARKGGHSIVLDCAKFEGLMRCDDAPALRKALLAGIGHGKAFGLGLLSIAPMATQLR